MSEQNANQTQSFLGLLAEFDQPETVIEATRSAKEAGFTKLDVYSPYPVHGIDGALGIRRTFLPFICLAVGIVACGIGIFLQWYTNAASSSPIFPGYDFRVGGKPMWSLPANVPVIFEVIVLLTAFAAFIGMLALNRLPRLANPLHRIPRFRRATNDRFFLTLDANDPEFDHDSTKQQLERWGASAVEPVYLDNTDQQLPTFVRTAGILIAILLLVPPVLTYRARGMTSRQPRLHVVPDMDFQVKYKPQNLGPVLSPPDAEEPVYLFADKRAARTPIPGTIPRDRLELDREFYQGIQAEPDELTDSSGATSPVSVGANAYRSGRQDEETGDDSSTDQAGDDQGQQQGEQQGGQQGEEAGGQPQDESDAAGEQSGEGESTDAAEAPPEPNWVTEFPEELTINEQTVRRGKRLFEINCVACHGYSGRGNGLVNQRALALAATGQAAWTTAQNLHHPDVINQPVGRIFDTITNGRNTMGPYGQRIEPQDRWAIVLYVRALQETIKNSEEKFIPPATDEGSGEDSADGAADGAADENADEETGNADQGTGDGVDDAGDD